MRNPKANERESRQALKSLFAAVALGGQVEDADLDDLGLVEHKHRVAEYASAIHEARAAGSNGEARRIAAAAADEILAAGWTVPPEPAPDLRGLNPAEIVEKLGIVRRW